MDFVYQETLLCKPDALFAHGIFKVGYTKKSVKEFYV